MVLSSLLFRGLFIRQVPGSQLHFCEINHFDYLLVLTGQTDVSDSKIEFILHKPGVTVLKTVFNFKLEKIIIIIYIFEYLCFNFQEIN